MGSVSPVSPQALALFASSAVAPISSRRVRNESRWERDWFGARDKRRGRGARCRDSREPTSCGGFPRHPHILEAGSTIQDVSPEDGGGRAFFDADAVTALGAVAHGAGGLDRTRCNPAGVSHRSVVPRRTDARGPSRYVALPGLGRVARRVGALLEEGSRSGKVLRVTGEAKASLA